MPTHSLNLDVHKRTSLVPPQVVCRQSESDTEIIQANLLDDGSTYTPTYTVGRLDIMHADGKWARVTATVSGSTISATLPSEALSGAGHCRLAHFVMENSDGTQRLTTEGFELIILPCVDTSGEGSKYYDDELNVLIERWLEFEAQAEANEEAREDAEATRQANETIRQTNEEAREDAEATRQANELERQENELARQTAETEREESEETRESQEAARVAAELERVAAESARQIAESSRADAEQAREDRFSQMEDYVEGVLVSELSGVDATTLPAGSDATVSLEDSILHFGIPQGEAGDAATIEVGIVSTLAAGSRATVINSGTSSAAVFDFGIPRGAAGVDGSIYGVTAQIYFPQIVAAVSTGHSSGKLWEIQSGDSPFIATEYRPNSEYTAAEIFQLLGSPVSMQLQFPGYYLLSMCLVLSSSQSQAVTIGFVPDMSIAMPSFDIGATHYLPASVYAPLQVPPTLVYVQAYQVPYNYNVAFRTYQDDPDVGFRAWSTSENSIYTPYSYLQATYLGEGA